jgi:hypothetical protein
MSTASSSSTHQRCPIGVLRVPSLLLPLGDVVGGLQALLYDPGHVYTLCSLARLNVQRGDYATAERSYEQARHGARPRGNACFRPLPRSPLPRSNQQRLLPRPLIA